MSVTDGMIEYFSSLDRRRTRAWVSVRSMLGGATGRETHLSGFLALCDQGVVSVTNFATGVIIGRVCGKAELGVYALAWTLMTLATAFSATLTTTPYTVFSPQLDRDQRRLYLGSILVHQLLVSMMLALVMVAGVLLGMWRGWLSHDLANVIAITACVTVVIGLREFARRVSFAELKVGLAFLVDLLACLAQGGGLLLLFYFGVLNVSRTYILFGISSGLVAGVWLAIHWGAIRLDVRLCVPDFKRNWLFSKWVLGSTLLWTGAMYLYPWLLAAFHGIAVTGLWAACATIVAVGNPVLLGLGNYVGPQIHNVYAASGATAMRRSVYRSSLLFGVLVLPVVLVLAGGGERIVTRVYGNTYAGCAGIVTLLALNMLISALTYPYSRGLFSLECSRADMLINVVAVILLFTVGIAAVKFFGALGAAAALLVSTAVTAVIRIGVFTREVRRDRAGTVTAFPASRAVI